MTSELKTCVREGCCPLEQVRGQLGPGDYYDVIANNAPGANSGRVVEPEKYGVPVRDGQDIGNHKQEHCVEMNDAISGDFRICCKACGKTTPWGAQDIPGMPGAGADWTRKRWNESL